ncbi:hypothetical protein OG225_41430 (plasmid) [Nocardia sp. NBC_01377]|uniref:hypothetical protein n=1 Tax=Nocardia sp. NBC_01377 TaxID=2903595 RepID=UPI002F909246
MIDSRSRWDRTVVSAAFVAEGCCFADMNGDGVDELVAGEQWWSLDDPAAASTVFRTVEDAWLPPWGGGPDRTDPHTHLREGGGPPQYKAATYDWPLPGRDGPALLSVGMHRDPLRWFEHRDAPGLWRGHEITRGGIYESVVYTALDPRGTRGLVTVPDRPKISWFEPRPDPYEPWIEHPVGDYGGNWHGLGVGAIDADTQPHILTPTCSYVPDGDIRRRWRRTALMQIDERSTISAGLGDVGMIHTHRFGTGPASLFAASPHGRGLWRWDLAEANHRCRIYQRRTLESTTSQLHALAVIPATAQEPVDAWVITGKRWHAHGPGFDLDPGGTPLLFRVGIHADPTVPAQTEVIDDSSGVGMQFAVRRLPDQRMQIATANKLGVHLFTEK